MAKLIDEDAERRFWAKVRRTSSCWVWTGATNPNGYGNVRLRGQFWKAHRLAWTIVFGSVGELQVLHHCDNPACVRPSHLFLGRHADNMRDRENKNRSNRARGSKHEWAILTEKQVRMIRAEWAAGAQALQLSRKYGISTSGMHDILHRKSWRHI